MGVTGSRESDGRSDSIPRYSSTSRETEVPRVLAYRLARATTAPSTLRVNLLMYVSYGHQCTYDRAGAPSRRGFEAQAGPRPHGQSHRHPCDQEERPADEEDRGVGQHGGDHGADARLAVVTLEEGDDERE